MKNFLNTIYVFFEAMGRARAASILARSGKVEEAKALYATK